MTADVVKAAITEDEVVTGLLDAMGLTGWAAWHARRSDRAIWQGTPGWPDITAVPPGPGPLLVIEVKSSRGAVTETQAQWLVRLHRRGVTCAVVRPVDYDRALDLILAGKSDRVDWEWAFRP